MLVKKFRAPAVIVLLFVITIVFSACTKEMTEEQSKALVGLEGIVSYYEESGSIVHYEELIALCAANQADGIAVNWKSLSLPETSQPGSDIATFTGPILTDLIKGEGNHLSMAQDLMARQNLETGSFDNEADIYRHIWAMITLNIAVNEDSYDYGPAASYLMSYRSADGGFAYTRDAETGNLELTGMAAVALAPQLIANEETATIEGIAAYIRSHQAEDGGLYDGERNPAVVASAIWGLTALDCELPETEEGLTPIDALLLYQNEDGSFRNSREGDESFDSYSTRRAAIALSDIVNDMNTFSLLATDSESYRIANVSGPSILFTVDYPDESGLDDIHGIFTVEKDSTAFDAIIFYGRVAGVPVSFSGSVDSRYVEAIGGISAGDYGEESGWIFYINGELPSEPASMVNLEADDHLEWIYVMDSSYLDEMEFADLDWIDSGEDSENE